MCATKGAYPTSLQEGNWPWVSDEFRISLGLDEKFLNGGMVLAPRSI